MAMAIKDRVSGNLVDVEHGLVSREIFVSDELYQRELEQVFARSWLFIGHESQVAKPGDFFVSSMGEESVILTRDRAGEIHVFLNTCRHRGMKVCRYDEGNTPVFTCPYHGWSYATDGTLAGVPHFKAAYHEELDKSLWGLVEVPQMANYKGTIWANWDPKAPSFVDYLGELRQYWDGFLELPDGSDGELEIIGGVHKWIMPCNWKFAAENFSGDNYHGVSHRSVDMLRISPSGGQGRHTGDNVRHPSKQINISVPEQGHGWRGSLRADDYPYTPTYQDMPIVEDYFREAYEKRQRLLGERSRFNGSGGTVFPNASPSNGRTSMAVWHPRGTMSTEAWRWYFVPKDAPQEVKDVLRHYVMRYAGAAGLTEQDDMENWNYASLASKGTIARRYPYNYEMGVGYEKNGGAYEWLGNVVITDVTTEQNQRGMYKRWAEYMDAQSWDDLMPGRNGKGRKIATNGGGRKRNGRK